MTPEQAAQVKQLINRADLKGGEIPIVVELLNALTRIEEGRVRMALVEDDPDDVADARANHPVPQIEDEPEVDTTRRSAKSDPVEKARSEQKPDDSETSDMARQIREQASTGRNATARVNGG